ncbi:hypothetical protein [Nocardia cyriacigeorgica]|nr:hypothetical protein [Nocardia cyriacigeorgica]
MDMGLNAGGFMMNRSNALGLVRRDIPCCPDRARDVLTELARRHGLRLAFTVELVAGPLVSNLVVAQHIAEHDAAAVIVPSFGHADGVRRVIIGAAALITPIRVYPRGYQWSRLEAGGEL